MAYCETTDLLKGDIPLPSYMAAGQGYIDTATDEMDTVLGQLYVTPIVLDPDDPLLRPSVLWLKTCCKFIASGRLILDLDISEENDNLHAYGLSLLNQGLEMLKAIQSGAASITGAIPLDPAAGTHPTGPMIYNVDTASLVQAGYEFLLDPLALPGWPPMFGSEVRPYS
jgi:hypothetical protein